MQNSPAQVVFTQDDSTQDVSVQDVSVQDSSTQNASAQLQSNVVPAGTSTAGEMLLAAVPAMTSESLPALKPSDLSAGTPTVAAGAVPGRSMKAEPIPTATAKLPTKNEASTQLSPASSPYVMPAAPSTGSNSAVLQPGNSTLTNSTVKIAATKRADSTGAAAPLVHGVAVQSTYDFSEAGPLNGIGSTAGDSSGAKQDDSNSPVSAPQSKDEAVAGAAAAAVQATPLQSTMVPLHLQGSPASQPLQDSPAPATSASASVLTPAKGTELDVSSSPDLKGVVNTSKLVQTLNQSEMRVGMRSTEFGDISIRTSSTRDSIVTQISLDHAELATSLAAHIPDMQARLEGHGNFEVRINTEHQNNGTASTMSDTNSGSQSRQQDQGSRSYFSSSYSNSSLLNSVLPTATLAATLQNAGNDGRIDVQA